LYSASSEKSFLNFSTRLLRRAPGVAKQKIHLTFFDSIYITSTKQFHEEPVNDKI